MKIFLALFISFVCLFCTGCNGKQKEDVLRIHIRANSNLEEDQEVKLMVRDCVIEFITPLIADCNNCNEVISKLQSNLSEIECVSDGVLKNCGFDYGVRAKINNEYFPSRDYDGKTFPADYYDALIVELGSGKGDNWWCVAYPPLCFVGYENGISGNIMYKSKLVELIKNFFGE